MARQFRPSLTLAEMQKRLASAPPALFEAADNELFVARALPAEQDAQLPELPAVLADGQDADAQLIRDWLTQLQMLKGVPFNYLVADMAMLPGESLRFFQVDKGWLNALLDGAFSIGAAGADSSSAQDACTALRCQAETAVSGCQDRRAMAAGGADCPEETAASGAGLSGFLLRSNLISAWPGLEVQGFVADDALSIVRMELLGPGLLLCLFNGVLTRVRFKLPAEAAHFGVGVGADGGYQKTLRSLAEPVGAATEQVSRFDLRPGGRRVVRLDNLAQDMAGKLGGSLTAAGFALQMVEGAQAVEFQWSKP